MNMLSCQMVTAKWGQRAVHLEQTTTEEGGNAAEEARPEAETESMQKLQEKDNICEPQRHSWFASRLRRLCGYAGVVVGEASNPGPAWCMYGERCPWHRERRCRYLHNGALDFWTFPEVPPLTEEVAGLRSAVEELQKELCATRQELADIRNRMDNTMAEPESKAVSKHTEKRQRQKARRAAENRSFEQDLAAHNRLIEEAEPQGPLETTRPNRGTPERSCSSWMSSPRPACSSGHTQNATNSVGDDRKAGFGDEELGHPEATARPPGLGSGAATPISDTEDAASEESWMCRSATESTTREQENQRRESGDVASSQAETDPWVGCRPQPQHQ